VFGDMHLDAPIVQVGDALGGRNRVSLEMHLEAMIVRTLMP